MDAIPLEKRRLVLDRALDQNGVLLDHQRDSLGGKMLGRHLLGREGGEGHTLTRDFRRTRGLNFCPPPSPPLSRDVDRLDDFDINDEDDDNHLVKMEFILPLDPGLRVLHYYYLADALMIDDPSSLVATSEDGGGEGEWAIEILHDIDTLVVEVDGEDAVLTKIEQIGTILDVHLPRGGGEGPNYNIPPASLSFTGYAAKFINLSPTAVNLYWDGGRLPSGDFYTVLVGTVPSMESIGTATFPGHQFHITSTFDADHVLQRWTITVDEPVLYHDPLAGRLME
jgi:hypothetical protein